jgi:hypothetical protein
MLKPPECDLSHEDFYGPVSAAVHRLGLLVLLRVSLPGVSKNGGWDRRLGRRDHPSAEGGFCRVQRPCASWRISSRGRSQAATSIAAASAWPTHAGPACGPCPERPVTVSETSRSAASPAAPNVTKHGAGEVAGAGGRPHPGGVPHEPAHPQDLGRVAAICFQALPQRVAMLRGEQEHQPDQSLHRWCHLLLTSSPPSRDLSVVHARAPY